MDLREIRDRVQPELLLYAIDRIEVMADQCDARVSDAIASTSELLHAISLAYQRADQSFSQEIKLLRQLLRLHRILSDKQAELEFIITGDPAELRLPPLLVFRMVDSVLRIFSSGCQPPEISLEISGFARMLTIQIMLEGGMKGSPEYESCLTYVLEVKEEIGEEMVMSIDQHPYGCSLCLVSNSP